MTRRLSALACVLLLSGCGYRLGSSTAAPRGVSTISIPAFVNNTYEPGVERAFTEAARAELSRRGVVRVVPSDGDAQLLGEVIVLDTLPLAPVAVDGGGGKLVPARYRVHAVARISLVQRTTGEVIWEDRLSADADFEAGGAPGFEALTRKANQDLVLEQVAAEILREATERMLADF